MRRQVLVSIIAHTPFVFALTGGTSAYGEPCCTKIDCGETIFCQEPDQGFHGGFSIIHSDGAFGSSAADSFTLAESAQIDRIRWWGTYLVAGSLEACGTILDDDFTLTIHTDAGGQLGAIVSSNPLGSSATRIPTGKQISFGNHLFDEYQFTTDLVQPFVASAGDTYWVVLERSIVDTCAWWWETAPMGTFGDGTTLWDQNGSGYLLENFDLAFCLNPIDVCRIPAVSAWSVVAAAILALGLGVALLRRRELVG